MRCRWTVYSPLPGGTDYFLRNVTRFFTALPQPGFAQTGKEYMPGPYAVKHNSVIMRTEFVAIAGLFLAPDIANNTWRVVLSREDLDPDKAREIELNNHGLTLAPLKDD
jgi:hypothetical protein